MAKSGSFPPSQNLDDSGNPLANGTVEFYKAGTTTPKAAFTTALGDVALPNPAPLDAAGRLDIWLGEGSYKIIVKDALGAIIDERDNITGDLVSGGIQTIASNTNINTSHQSALLLVTGVTTLSLLSAETAGLGFSFTVKNIGTDTVTIDPDAAQTIDAVATETLETGDWATIYSDGANWHTVGIAELADLVRTLTGGVSGLGALAPLDELTSNFIATSAFATQIEAEEGTDQVKIMNSLRVKEAIDAQTPALIDDDTMATATADNVASAESIKAYVDASNTVHNAGDVGSYALLGRISGGGALAFGSTIAGSNLRPSDVDNTKSGSVAGTWRCMGYQNGNTGATLFQRIS